MSTRNASKLKFSTMGHLTNMEQENPLYCCVTGGLLGDSKTQTTGTCSFYHAAFVPAEPQCALLEGGINRLSLILVLVSKNT